MDFHLLFYFKLLAMYLGSLRSKNNIFLIFKFLMNHGLLIWRADRIGHPYLRNVRKTIRFIFNMKFLETCQGVFKYNNILTLPIIYNGVSSL